jgi:uncharacterized protein (TIGR02217 family)
MAFHEVRFPDNISRGARGGPERRTQIVELASGAEERNASWANSRRRYDVAYGIRRADDLAAVVAFFEARNGRLHGFRFKDWADFKSCPGASGPDPARRRRARTLSRCEGHLDIRHRPHRRCRSARSGPDAARDARRSRCRDP